MSDLVSLPNAVCRSEKYRLGLIDLINDLKIPIETMVEVGSYQGESTVIFAEQIKTLKKLYAVDPWKNGYSTGDICSDEYPMDVVESNFDIRIKNYPQIIKQKTTSEEFASQIEDGSLDFVYIDGDHSYESCKKDIETWLPKVKKGGVIAGHDYLAACFLGVVTAVNETFGTPDKNYEDTSWVKFL
jgi:predicted O-methyltransferase YrrM